MTFAKGTKTSIDTTEQQIKKMLQKAGATGTAFMEERSRAIVAFHLNERSIQFRLPLPERDDSKFTHWYVKNSHGLAKEPTPRSADAAANLWVQACRERWRALHLCIKAKLESVEQGIETFDESFLAHIQTPDGRTVGDQVIPEMLAQLEGKPMRPLLAPPDKR